MHQPPAHMATTELEDMTEVEREEIIHYVTQHLAHLSQHDPAALRGLLENLPHAAATDPRWDAGFARVTATLDAMEAADPQQYLRDSTWFRSNLEDALTDDNNSKTVQ